MQGCRELRWKWAARTKKPKAKPHSRQLSFRTDRWIPPKTTGHQSATPPRHRGCVILMESRTRLARAPINELRADKAGFRTPQRAAVDAVLDGMHQTQLAAILGPGLSIAARRAQAFDQNFPAVAGHVAGRARSSGRRVADRRDRLRLGPDRGPQRPGGGPRPSARQRTERPVRRHQRRCDGAGCGDQRLGAGGIGLKPPIRSAASAQASRRACHSSSSTA